MHACTLKMEGKADGGRARRMSHESTMAYIYIYVCIYNTYTTDTSRRRNFRRRRNHDENDENALTTGLPENDI